MNETPETDAFCEAKLDAFNADEYEGRQCQEPEAAYGDAVEFARSLERRLRGLQVTDGVVVPRDFAVELREQMGWHGSGEHDLERFYCEFCTVDHEDGNKIEHRPWCPIAKLDKLIAAAPGVEVPKEETTDSDGDWQCLD